MAAETLKLNEKCNHLWHKMSSAISLHGTYVSDIFTSYDQLVSITPASELKKEADKVANSAIVNIKDLILQAAAKAGASYIDEDTANSILDCHKGVLDELEKLDKLRNRINKALSGNISRAQVEVSLVNQFMRYADAGTVGLKPISIEQLKTIRMPEGYNDGNLRAKINKLNDYSAVTGIVAGGLGLASLFSSSKARGVVTAATGILAVGLAIASSVSRSRGIKEECNKMVECMRNNLDIVTANIKNIQAAIEKVREVERIRQLAEGYFDMVRKSVMAIPFHIFPKEVSSINFCQVDPTITANLQKIYDTFSNIANRKYLDQEEEKPAKKPRRKALPAEQKALPDVSENETNK